MNSRPLIKLIVNEPPPEPVNEKPVPGADESHFSFGSKLSWFLLGLFLGSFLENFSVSVMIIIGLIVDNQQLPEFLGSVRVQRLCLVFVKNLFQSILTVVRKSGKEKY